MNPSQTARLWKYTTFNHILSISAPQADWWCTKYYEVHCLLLKEKGEFDPAKTLR